MKYLILISDEIVRNKTRHIASKAFVSFGGYDNRQLSTYFLNLIPERPVQLAAVEAPHDVAGDEVRVGVGAGVGRRHLSHLAAAAVEKAWRRGEQQRFDHRVFVRRYRGAQQLPVQAAHLN